MTNSLYRGWRRRVPLQLKLQAIKKSKAKQYLEGTLLQKYTPQASYIQSDISSADTTQDKLVTTPSADVRTIFDILKRSADKFGNAKAVGTRKLIKMHNETKKVKKVVDGQEQEVDKKWSYYELSGYSYISFIEYQTMALQIGAGLAKLGLTAGDRVHLFAATRSVQSTCC